MKHAVLGLGGVGGLIATLLAHNGEDVTGIVRPQKLSDSVVRLHADRPSGPLEASIALSNTAPHGTDVLWIAVKATQLESALGQLGDSCACATMAVPLLNGIDHLDRLRAIFGKSLVPATISVEAERIGTTHVVQRSAFVRFAIAENGRSRLEPVMQALAGCGVEHQFLGDEATLMWSKLCFLAPLALVTSASGMPIGEVRSAAIWAEYLRAVTDEVCAVAIAEGATIYATKVSALHASLPPGMRSSMQKDVAAGRKPELDAIAAPIVRCGEKHGIPTETVQRLSNLIRTNVSRASAVSRQHLSGGA